MFVIIIFLVCVYYISKVVLRKYHDFVINFRQQIVDDIEWRRLVQQLYLIYTSWFPPETRIVGQAILTETPNNQRSNVTSDSSEISKAPDLRTKLKNTDLQEIPIGITTLDMALILDDDHLEKLSCSQCGKYLSVLPVKMYPNNIIKCGRCSEENDGGTKSLYEDVVKNCLFKCVNRYVQCTKFLTVSEVTEHEKDCFSGNYDCPNCETNKFSGSAFDLLRHYKNAHRTKILQNNKFYVDVRGMPINKERYLYVKNDIIFFILLENLYGENILLSVVSLTPHKYLKQQFDVKFLGEDLKVFKTEKKLVTSLNAFKCDYFKIEIGNCLPEKVKCKVNIDFSGDVQHTAQEIPMLFKKPKIIPVISKGVETLPQEQITGVELTDKFKKEYPDYNLTPCGTAVFDSRWTRTELTCSNCKLFTGSNVYSCANHKHVMCWECRGKQCKCKVPTGGWDARVSSLNELLLLPCRWKCGGRFPGNRLRQHEAQCELKA